jgi:hypothetical protein
MKKLMTYSAVLASTAFLVGCGGGSSSNTPPAGTKATVNIINKSESTYSRAILLDQNGAVVAQQDINCQPATANCEIYLTKSLDEQPLLLVIQDSEGHLIRAFKATGVQLTESLIDPSNNSTGFYLTQQLQRGSLSKVNVPSSEVFVRLKQFFQNYQSPDGFPEYNEEVGEYYAKQRSANPTLTETQFLEDLAKRLAKWDIASPDELPQSGNVKQANLHPLKMVANALSDLIHGRYELVKPAYAQTVQSGCSDGLSTFLKLGGGSAQAIPIAGGLVSELFNIATASCSTEDEVLALISSKLDTLQQSVDGVGATLAQVKSLVEAKWINDQTQKFRSNRDMVAKAIKKYNDFLANNKINGTSANNLEQWFSSKGGYKAATSDPVVKASVLEVLTSMNTVMDEMTKLTSDANLDTYYQALNSQCGNISTNSFTPGMNFVARRQACNNVLFTNTALLMGSEAMVLPMAKDIYSVLDTYSKSEGSVVYNDVKFPFISSDLTSKDKSLEITSYNGAFEKIKRIFRAQQDEFLSDLKRGVGHKDGYFKAYAGLPEPMLTRIGKVCGSKVNGQSTLDPAIVGWYSPSGIESERYVVTNCYLIDGNAANNNTMSPVNAKYYYATGKTKYNYENLVNVMGVLADKTPVVVADLRDGAPDYTFERFTTTEKGLVFYAPKLLAYSQSGVNSDAYVPTYSSTGATKPNYLYKTDNPSLGYYKATLDSTLSVVPTWLLFKDGEGYHHVVLLILNTATGKIISLHCKTPDCSVGDGQEWLKFSDSDLVVDVSYMSNHAYVDNMYVYQLGPLK